MTWRLAGSLVRFREQANKQWPNRSKASDGAIGDAAHQKEGSASDHNPWVIDNRGVGVVTAFDLTHDPANGVDIDKISDVLVESRDNRIKYMIANGLICVPTDGWMWQPYRGVDPHTNHLHISVNTNNYDDQFNWKLIKEEDMARDAISIEEATDIYTGYVPNQPLNREWVKKWTGKKLSDALQDIKNDPSRQAYITDIVNSADAYHKLMSKTDTKGIDVTPLKPGVYEVK